MKYKLLAGAAAMMASSAAMAGSLTGNVGIVSDYMFRGIDQAQLVPGASSSSPAVQGGVDYGFDLGIYTGLWVTNSSLGGGNEADVYAGYGTKFGPVSFDAGAIYYAYTEDTETAVGYGQNTDYAEAYVGAGFGPATLKVFYAPKYGRDTPAGSTGNPHGSGDTSKNSMMYVTASAVFNLNDTIAVTPELGYSTGDGVKDDPYVGDNYIDYSVTATKKLKDDLSVSLAFVGTNLKDYGGTTNNTDVGKFVIGVKKNFKI